MLWNTDSSDLYIDTYVTRDITSLKTYFLSGTFRNCAPQPYDGSSSLLMKIREKTGLFKFTDDNGESSIFKVLGMAYVPTASHRLVLLQYICRHMPGTDFSQDDDGLILTFANNLRSKFIRYRPGSEVPVLQVNIGCKTSKKIATACITLFQKVVISYPSKYPDPITDCITQDIGWEKVNISTLSLLASYRTLCTSSFDQDVDIVKNCFQPRQTLQTFD